MVVKSKIKGKENDQSKRIVDHWAFLEEIEAPMWVDLSLESKLPEDNDDAWFQMSHPFHYHSARHLRSAFAHPDVGSDHLNFNLRGDCSQTLPSSVSKSRGKDYRSRVWRNNHHQVSLDEGHPISDLGGVISNCSTNVLSQQCKPQVSLGNQTEVSSSITSVVYDSGRRIALNSLSTSTSGVSSSTITSVHGLRDSKVLGMPKDAFGHMGSLLNSLRNLRKSHVTRPAMRVEISDDKESRGYKSSDGNSGLGSSSTTGSYDTKGKDSSGHKSSTGKSSVVSSITGNDMKGKEFSVVPKVNQIVEINGNTRAKGLKVSSGRPNSGFSNPKFEVKKKDAHLKSDKVKRLDVRDFSKSAKPINGRVKAKKMSEASISAKNAYCSKIEVKDPDAHQQPSKSKVLLQKINLNRSKIAQGVKGKVGSNQFAYSGKENIRVRAGFSQNIGGKDKVTAAAAADPKSLTLKSKDKVRVTSVDSKVRIGRMTDTRMTRDTLVYLR